MKYACITMAALVSTVAVEARGLRASEYSTSLSDPYVIYWPRVPERPPTPVGLLYTPELLAEMARRSPDSVSARIRDAIRQQMPVVVMWTIPPLADTEPWPRPFSIVIVERGSEYSGVPRVEPVWTQQHAEDLRQLDRRTEFQDVGVMAAFPRSAFVPGRLVIIYLRLQPEAGLPSGVQRFGFLDWNGAQP